MGGGQPAMQPLQQQATGMLTDPQPQPHAQQRQQQQSSHDQRMRFADGAGGSGDTSDSDSCRSGDSDGEEDGMASARGAAAANGRRHSGAGTHDSSPVRLGHWSTSQPLAIKQEAGQDRGAGRAGHNNRTKKPHLKVSCRLCESWQPASLCGCWPYMCYAAVKKLYVNLANLSLVTLDQGRFSGRLETKNDEKLLADECRLLGPMLGGTGKRGEKSRLTLAKIVRGIAAGDVRRFCEAREGMLRVRTCRSRLVAGFRA